MLINNICGYIVLVSLSVAVVLIVLDLVRNHLRDLLNEVVRIPSATVFYVRAFTISVIFLALANVISSRFSLKINAHFMEYVLKIGEDLSGVFREISYFLLGYLLLITILIVVLKRKNE